MLRFAWVAVVLAACGVQPAGDVGVDPDEATGTGGKADGDGGVPDVRCADAPAVGDAVGFRHTGSKLTAALGGDKHRGIDLIATSDAAAQVIAGELSYGVFDKALEDEDVDVFACRAGAWVALGSARTGDEGDFQIVLTGDDRLPIGLRDMFLSVRGDRTSARFLAWVAPASSQLAVSDVDGTLTPFEAAFVGSSLGIDIGIHEGAPEAFAALVARGMQPVYVTARARSATQATRAWLAQTGMPRGPVRLADGVLLPGSATVAYKTDTLRAFDGFELALGNGNRESDIEAYTAAGVPANRITIKLPEYTLEVQGALDRGEAIGFDAYDELLSKLDAAAL
jgi:hypothetical protein